MERHILNRKELGALFARHGIDAKAPRPGCTALVGTEKIMLDVQRISKNEWLVIAPSYAWPRENTEAQKEPEAMVIEPGSELDKRAEANETAIDAMNENDVRALAQALGHRITDRNGNARDTQALRDALKQTHPDDFDAAMATIKPADTISATFDALHDAKPEPFNAAYDPDHHVKAAVVSAMVEAGEPYPSREARAEARAKAYASLDSKRLAFESIVFAQGEDANEPLRLLNHESEQAALDYLLQWDTGDGYEPHNVAPWGESDRLWGKGDLLVSYNNPLGYIGLCRVIIQD